MNASGPPIVPGRSLAIAHHRPTSDNTSLYYYLNKIDT